MRSDPDDFSQEKKQAIQVLSDLANVLPDNSRYNEVTNMDTCTKTVAIKKSKVNAFNDRDGVLFYALREAQILQKLKG